MTRNIFCSYSKITDIKRPSDLVLWQHELLYFGRLLFNYEFTVNQIIDSIVYPYSENQILKRRDIGKFELEDTNIFIDERVLKKEKDGVFRKDSQDINNNFLFHNNILIMLNLFRNIFINNSIDCFFGEIEELPSAYIFKSQDYTTLLFKTAFEKIEDHCYVYVSEQESRRIIHQFLRKHEKFNPFVQKLIDQRPLVRFIIDILWHTDYERIFQEFPNYGDFAEYKNKDIILPAAQKLLSDKNLNPTDIEKVVLPILRDLHRILFPNNTNEK